MLSRRFGYVFVLTFLHCTYGERRLIGGQDVKTQKRYMAYLIQAKSSIHNYDAWICGGAIISPWLMLTSAACVEDVQNMYAIAGTELYVTDGKLDNNLCTRHWRRKVIFTCVPIAYDLQYDKVGKWSHNDVAIVKVEKPFVTKNESWKDCSYSPVVINVNYNPKNEKPGTEAIVLGWGHTSKWRSMNSTDNLNQKQLQYASVSVLNNKECKKSFTKPDMGKLIDDYMICTLHDGKLDESGKKIASRKNANVAIYTVDGEEITDEKEIEKYLNSTQKPFNLTDEATVENPRRVKGFCQNDHGGPLVTWIKGKERVIGIASVFRVDNQSNCMGPFLYISTAKYKKFIRCVLKQIIKTDDKIRTTRSVCDKPKEGKEFAILRTYVQWTDSNTDSLAPNLNVHLRPQIPIKHYGRK